VGNSLGLGTEKRSEARNHRREGVRGNSRAPVWEVKVVLDTNVYVSAFLFDRGPERIIELSRAGHFRVFSSLYIVEELREVLAGKLGTSQRFAALAAIRVAKLSRVVGIAGAPSEGIQPIEPRDSPILKTCFASKADFLITGDKQLLALRLRGIAISTPHGFLQHLRSLGVR
jgi:uncharacterized protein